MVEGCTVGSLGIGNNQSGGKAKPFIFGGVRSGPNGASWRLFVALVAASRVGIRGSGLGIESSKNPKSSYTKPVQNVEIYYRPVLTCSLQLSGHKHGHSTLH